MGAAAPTFFITATCPLYTCTLRPAGHKWGSDPNMIRSYPHIPIILWSLKRHKTPVSEALSVMAVKDKSLPCVCRNMDDNQAEWRTWRGSDLCGYCECEVSTRGSIERDRPQDPSSQQAPVTRTLLHCCSFSL